MNYQYQIIDNSILSKIFNPICFWIEKFIPKWITPNMITCSGLLSTLMALNISQNNNILNIPIVFSLTLFYIFMDTLDGIHARKTNQSSILGEFLDHIFDCIYSSYMFIILYNLTETNNKEIKYICSNLPPIIFSLSHAEAYKNGFVYFSKFGGPLEFLLFYLYLIIFSKFYYLPIIPIQIYFLFISIVSIILFYHTKSVTILFTSFSRAIALYYPLNGQYFVSILMVSELILAKIEDRKIYPYLIIISILSFYYDITYLSIGILIGIGINLQKFTHRSIS